MSDFKSVKQLCEENPNLNNHILSLSDVITELEHKNKELEKSLIDLRKYYQSLDKFAATVYDPNKSTYKELEEKVAKANEQRQKDIDELWETRINPMQKRIEEYENALRLVQSMSANDTIELKDLRNIIKDQQTIINYAAGYISACEQFRDKHPTDVIKWLFKGLK